jgi:hypothetical protein
MGRSLTVTADLPKTFQPRFNLSNEHDVRIARFLQNYPWWKTQKVKEILLLYIDGQLGDVPSNPPDYQATPDLSD